MRAALSEASKATGHDDVPVGAIIIDTAWEIIAADHNRTVQRSDPTAHAEMLVISTVAQERGDWRLNGLTLVVTLEPCPMCAGAAVWARLDRIVYGAPDPKAGAAWSLYNIPQDARLNHRCELTAGVMADESAALLSEFFRSRR
ncbi:MAG: tRNA-specific adenosine deaminase [Gammaproteobacteria bacterium]|nr:tRNA-specific adenosine deaminase [Gammaproteobacteria bacterium]